MKKYVTRAAVVLSLLICACVAGASAQPEGPITGGYGAVSVKDRSVKTAAGIAIRDHVAKEHHSLTLVRIVKAEQQVVAGMNYRMCLRVRRPGHKAHNVTAVVYDPLRGRTRLTDWTEDGCK